MARKRALGKGLGALLPEQALEESNPAPTLLPVEHIGPNPDQPRKEMDPDRLQELADSIGRHGLLQPIVVCADPEGPRTWKIIAGERRWRASRMAGLEEVPVHALQEPKDITVLALIENIQREDLSPIEIASSMEKLRKEQGLTQEEIASLLGWSRSGVTNRLRLLQLPQLLQEMIQQGIINEGHGRVLVGLDEEVARRVAEQVVDQELSVRQTEMLVRKIKKGDETARTSKKKSLQAPQIAQNLHDRFGIGVSVQKKGKGHSIILTHMKEEQKELFLDHLLEICEKLFPGK